MSPELQNTCTRRQVGSAAQLYKSYGCYLPAKFTKMAESIANICPRQPNQVKLKHRGNSEKIKPNRRNHFFFPDTETILEFNSNCRQTLAYELNSNGKYTLGKSQHREAGKTGSHKQGAVESNSSQGNSLWVHQFN